MINKWRENHGFFFKIVRARRKKRGKDTREHPFRNQYSGCIDAHMKWKGRLQKYLDGTSEEKLDPMVVCRDDQCVLGKWIHGPALNHFHNDEDFHKLRADHANFHFVAGTVVKKIQENDFAGSDALMKSEYARASRDVIQGLMELNKHLNHHA